MRDLLPMLVLATAMGINSGTAHGQEDCSGDCDADGQAVVNELITGVNIALGSVSVTNCTAFDSDSNGGVVVNELVLAVNNALNGCVVAPGDEVTCNLVNSLATVQSTLFPLELPVTGSIVFTLGAADAGGNVPVIVKSDDLMLNPISVPGLTCACIIALPSEAGNTAVGEVGCSEDGLPEIDYVAEVDHEVKDTSIRFTAGGGRGSILLEASVGFVIGGDPSCAGIDCRTIDRSEAVPLAAPLTSGTATAQILNVNGTPDRVLGVGVSCGGRECKVSESGTAAECEDLAAGDLEGAFSGAGLVFAYPALEVPTVQDIVVTAIFTCE